MSKRKIIMTLAVVLLLAVTLTGCTGGNPSAPELPGEQSNEPTEHNWMISINDTQKFKQGNQNVTMTLTINSYKDGGTDASGTYKGNATLTYNFSMSEGIISGDADGMGYDNEVEFTLSDDFLHPLMDTDVAPGYELSAWGWFTLTGDGTVEERVYGAKWNTEGAGTQKHEYLITIHGTSVKLYIPTIAPGPFNGTVVRTPLY